MYELMSGTRFGQVLAANGMIGAEVTRLRRRAMPPSHALRTCRPRRTSECCCDSSFARVEVRLCVAMRGRLQVGDYSRESRVAGMMLSETFETADFK